MFENVNTPGEEKERFTNTESADRLIKECNDELAAHGTLSQDSLEAIQETVNTLREAQDALTTQEEKDEVMGVIANLNNLMTLGRQEAA